MNDQIVLENFLNDMAVIRTTFETLKFFPSGDPIETELREFIEDARQSLLRGMEAVCEEIRTNPALLPFPLRAFQREMLRSSAKGWNKRQLDNFMRLDAFDDGSASLYYFEVTPIFDRELAEKMSAQEFASLIFSQMLVRIQRPENYLNRKIFEAAVFQHFLFILFVSYCVKLYPFIQP